MRTNHLLLVAAGCAWNLCLTFEPEQVAEMLGPAERQAIEQVLRVEFGDAAGFVMKDPRLCLTLPAWLPGLRAVGSVASALLVIRHPAEVVRSLAARNSLAEAETAPNWLHHMLEAERLTRGMHRAVLTYDDLLRDWRGCLTRAGRAAGIDWPLPVEQAEREVDRFLSGAQRHHAAAEAVPAVGPDRVREMIATVWIALQRLADEPTASDALATLDQVRAQFAVWRREVCPPGFRVVLPPG